MSEQEALLNEIGEDIQNRYAKQLAEMKVTFFIVGGWVTTNDFEVQGFGNGRHPIDNAHLLSYALHHQLQLAMESQGGA